MLKTKTKTFIKLKQQRFKLFIIIYNSNISLLSLIQKKTEYTSNMYIKPVYNPNFVSLSNVLCDEYNKN